MYILKGNDNVVLAKCDSFETVENGYLINDSIYPTHFGEMVEISETEVTPQKHKYVDGAIITNQDYVNSVDAQIQQAIDAYKQELIEGGLL